MKGFQYLIDEYGEVHTVKEDDIDRVAGLVSQAVRKLVMADLNLKNQDFKATWAGDYIEGGGLKRKIKESMEAVKPMEIAGHINYYFASEYAIKNYYNYTVDIEDVNVLYCKGMPKDTKSVYTRLITPTLSTSGLSFFSKPIDKNFGGGKIVFEYKKMRDEIQRFMKKVEVQVEGQKEVGTEEDVDVLLHGNQVMETLTENGITFNVEKSGDLPKDRSERKTMIDNMKSDLDGLKSDESIVNYSINEQANKTVVKIVSKKLEKFSKKYYTQSLDVTRLND